MVLKYGFRGLMVPVFTPFAEAQRQPVNVSLIPKYAEYLKDNGVMGILVNGTTGEGVSMTTTERKSVTEAWANTVKATGQTLMVQVGGSSLADVKELAEHAEMVNASGILCLPDLFFRPNTVKELVDYLKHVSNAAPNTCLFYYHIPSFTGVNLAMNEFLKLGLQEINNLSGIKFTHNDLDQGAKCLKIHEDFTIFLGADTIFSAALTLGFDSGIMTTLNFWPEKFREIQLYVKVGKIKEAASVQSTIAEDIDKILSGGNWVHQMKLHMVDKYEMKLGLTRPPLGGK